MDEDNVRFRYILLFISVLVVCVVRGKQRTLQDFIPPPVHFRTLIHRLVLHLLSSFRRLRVAHISPGRNMTLPNKQGYSSKRANRKQHAIHTQNLTKKRILAHPLSDTLVIEQTKLGLCINNAQNQRSSCKISESNLHALMNEKRQELGIRSQVWTQNDPLNPLLLAAIQSTIAFRRSLEEQLAHLSLNDGRSGENGPTNIEALFRSISFCGDTKRKYIQAMEKLEAPLQKRSKGRLDDKATGVLVQWFEQHITKPYPDKAAKEEISQKTGLTHNQIRNWFTNIRKRHWTPIVKGREPRSAMDVEILTRCSDSSGTVNVEEGEEPLVKIGAMGGVNCTRKHKANLKLCDERMSI